jgi:septal ring factor EnvC (AmiA/AmiB activator)
MRFFQAVGNITSIASSTVTMPSIAPVSSIEEVKRQRPADDDLFGLAEYHEQLARIYQQQATLESRLRFVEVTSRSHDEQLTDIVIRLDELERNQSSLAELLQLLRVELLTPAHQNQVRSWVNELARLTGWHITAIFTDLAADFEYKTFGDAREADWKRIEEYFRQKLEDARERKR